MKCIKCGFNNNATVAYCQKCGGKLDMTADEIRDALVHSAQGDRALNTEYYARQSLFFAIMVFAIALTLLIVASGAQTDTYAVPSIVTGVEGRGTNYTEVTFRVKDRLNMEKAVIPFSDKRR